jgi:hypothetical protein
MDMENECPATHHVGEAVQTVLFGKNVKVQDFRRLHGGELHGARVDVLEEQPQDHWGDRPWERCISIYVQVLLSFLGSF